jgi:hypothetical protein
MLSWRFFVSLINVNLYQRVYDAVIEKWETTTISYCPYTIMQMTKYLPLNNSRRYKHHYMSLNLRSKLLSTYLGSSKFYWQRTCIKVWNTTSFHGEELFTMEYKRHQPLSYSVSCNHHVLSSDYGIIFLRYQAKPKSRWAARIEVLDYTWFHLQQPSSWESNKEKYSL